MKKLLLTALLSTISSVAIADSNTTLLSKDIHDVDYYPVPFISIPHSNHGFANYTDKKMSIRIIVTSGTVHITSSDTHSACANINLSEGDEIVCSYGAGHLLDILNHSDNAVAHGTYQRKIDL